MSQVELAFLTRPVAGEMAPGMPTPTDGASARLGLELAYQRRDGREARAIVPARSRNPPRRRRHGPRGPRSDGFDLGAAEVNADAKQRLAWYFEI